MPTTTIYQKAIVTTRKRYGACINDELLGNVAIGQTVISQLDPAHRVKPNPLSNTSLGLQFTSVKKYGHHVDVTTSFTGTCAAAPTGRPPFINEAHIWVSPPLAIPVVDAPNWALAMRGKILDDKVSFADTIGEWRESVHMLGQATSALHRAWKAALRLWKLRHARRFLKRWFVHTFGRDPSSKLELMDAVSVDLAIKFGIKPTANLIWDSTQQLNRYLIQKRRLTVTLKEKGAGTYPGEYGGAYAITVEKSYRAICYVTYNMDSREFTSGNLAEALWAGTRLSFMVDWFINVGSYLASFSAMRGVTSVTGVLCKRERRSGTDSRILTKDGHMLERGKYEYRSYARDYFTGIPMAHFPSVRLPEGNLVAKIWSSLEVLYSIRKRRLDSA